MGRRRRRVIRILKKTLPKVFTCPQCGMIAIRVTAKEDGTASIACGSCNLAYEYTISGKKESIDIYNDFVDRYITKRS